MLLENLPTLKKWFSTKQRVLLVAHRNPDGDAIGSTMALKSFLKLKGHEVRVIYPSDYPSFLSWVPDIDDVIIYDNDISAATEVINWASVYGILDFNDWSRIDQLGASMRLRKVPSFVLDHHLFPSKDFDLLFSDTKASSTCEIVYKLIVDWDKTLLTNEVAEMIYLGILTDTGIFKYATRKELFVIVSKLIDGGLDHLKIQNLVENNIPEKNLRLLGHCLHNRMEVIPELQTGIIYLSQEDYTTFDIKRGDTEGIVNYLLRIKGINIAAMFMHQPTIVKISLRSIGDFSVQQIAKDHFNGGGHKNAAGGAYYGTLDAAIAKFKKVLPHYLEN